MPVGWTTSEVALHLCYNRFPDADRSKIKVLSKNVKDHASIGHNVQKIEESNTIREAVGEHKDEVTGTKITKYKVCLDRIRFLSGNSYKKYCFIVANRHNRDGWKYFDERNGKMYRDSKNRIIGVHYVDFESINCSLQ